MDPQWITLIIALALLVFNVGRHFGADREVAKWRIRVDRALEPLAALPEWKHAVTTRQHVLGDRVEYVHQESKKRDDQIRGDLTATVSHIGQTYVTLAEYNARRESE